MPVTDIPAASIYAADLDRAQALIDKARLTAVPPGTRAHVVMHLELPSPEAVDAVAAQWEAEAGWTEDGRQYRAESGISAGYHPDPLRLLRATEASGSAA